MNPDPQRRKRVLIVDDQPIVRLGIRHLLATERDFETCGEAGTVDVAKALTASTRPDLAIVDLSLAEGSGLDLIGWLHNSVPTLPVLVLSMHEEALFAERVRRAGARGYLMKREAITGLVAAIRRVLSGGEYFSERIAQAALARRGEGGAATPDSSPATGARDTR